MAKVLSVYLNDYELGLLQNLRQVLNVPEEGRVMKMALKHLGNDHQHGEPATGRIEEGLRVEVPAMVQLRSMVKTCLSELKQEKKVNDWIWGKTT